MGKASNELNQNRSLLFEEMNYDVQHAVVDDNTVNSNDANEMDDEEWDSIISAIHQAIISYTEHEGSQICEYLKLEDIEKCLSNILSETI
tara:strand:- start:301 stop:570 length:270 start_codon:yes stop_codon:yes gene_type:complete